MERALALPEEALPPMHAPLGPGELPQPRSWHRNHEEAASALETVRAAVRTRAEELRLPQEILLAPDAQRHLAWELGEEQARCGRARTSTDAIAARLVELEARPWQIEQVAPALAAALS